MRICGHLRLRGTFPSQGPARGWARTLLSRHALDDLGETRARDGVVDPLDAAALIDDPGARRADVPHRLAQHPQLPPRSAVRRFHFDHDARAAAVQHQVGFGAGRGTPEVGAGTRMCDGFAPENILDDERFPARAAHRVRLQLLMAADVQQVVQQPGIPQVELRRLDQALADVAEIRWQPPQQEDPLQHVQVPLDGQVVDPQRRTDLRRVGDSALRMGEHGEQAAHEHRVGPQAVLRKVALEHGAQIRFPPRPVIVPRRFGDT